MMNWLFDLSDTLLIAGAAAMSLAMVAATGLIARLRPEESKISDAALDAYKITVNFTAILLSFSLVQAVGSFRSTEAAVSKEAGSMNQLDRLLVRYETPNATAIRPLLNAYLRSVVQEEWPAMEQGGASVPTGMRLRTLNRAVHTLDGGVAAKPQLYAEMLRQLDGLNDARQERVDAGNAGVPGVLWKAVAALGLVLLVLSALIRIPGRLVALGGHAMSIGVLMALVFAVDAPFRGETAVSVAPIQRVLASVLTRTE